MSKIQRLELPENLETIQIGKSWLLETHFDPDRGVVVSITRQSSAVTVSTWRSKTNWTSNMVSSLGDWANVPKSVRFRHAADMMARQERIFAKTGKHGYYFPAGCRIAFRRKTPTECTPA